MRTPWDDLKFFCIFVGWPRSGHSLVGSLLDAHPNAIVAHELHVLPLVEKGIGRTRLFEKLRDLSATQARGGREVGGYKYWLEGQYAGRVHGPLLVLGDKKGGATGAFVSQQGLDTVRALEGMVGVPVKWINVVRNPLDIVATVRRKHYATLPEVEAQTRAAKLYLNCARGVYRVERSTPPARFHRLTHEALIADPQYELRLLLEFLGLEPHADYLEAVGKLLYRRPSKTRSGLEWNERVREEFAAEAFALPWNVSYLESADV